MSRIVKVLFLLVGLFAAGTASAEEKGTAAEAQAMAAKAVALYKAQGKDKAFAAFEDPAGEFKAKDLYVFVLDPAGKLLAHGGNKALTGKDMSKVKDADGKQFVMDLVGLAKDGKTGWVDYKWNNPTTKQIEAKSTYVVPHEGMAFAVGIYK